MVKNKAGTTSLVTTRKPKTITKAGNVSKAASSVQSKNTGKGKQVGGGYPVVQKVGNVNQILNLGAAEILSEFDYIAMGQKGISRDTIDNLAQYMGISRKILAEDIFDISVKTLERKGPSEKVDKKISSHVVEIAKLLQHAYNVFDDEEKVRHWINTKNSALNNKTPVAIFDTLTGLNLVNDILTRIEEGVYS